MGGIVSELLEETRHLEDAGVNKATTGPTHPVCADGDYPENDDTGEAVEVIAEDATQHDLSAQARHRRMFRGRRRRPLQSCGRGHHRICRQQGLRAWPKMCPLNGSNCRPLTFGERLERLYELEDPTMAQRSSTPTLACDDPQSSYRSAPVEEEEYWAWRSYLQTPGTFHGQLKPNQPGAFSGMCFPQSDPRWIICHHPNVPAAVKSIIIN